MSNSSLIRTILLYTFPIISWHAFMYVGFNMTILKAIYFIFLPIVGLYVYKELSNSNSIIKRKFKQLTLIILLSIIMSWLIWDQPISLGYRSTAPILSIIYIFLLYKYQYTEKELRKFIQIQFIIYIILFSYALYKAPEIIFGFDVEKELNDDRGIFRISIANRGFLILSYFMFLNNWITKHSKKYLCLASLAFAFIILTTIRQVIFLSLLISLVYLFRKWKYIWVSMIALIIVINTISIKINNDSILGSLIDLTEQQINDNQSGDTNIRLLEYKYYFTKYSDNPLAWLFGNGQYHANSEMGKYESRLMNYYGYFQSDVGYARIYVQWGIIGLILIFTLFYYPLKFKFNNNVIFLKLFVIYQIFANIAASWIWPDIISICITFYMIDNFVITNKHSNSTHEIFNSNSRL